jgi:hypothetical protein
MEQITMQLLTAVGRLGSRNADEADEEVTDLTTSAAVSAANNIRRSFRICWCITVLLLASSAFLFFSSWFFSPFGGIVLCWCTSYSWTPPNLAERDCDWQASDCLR